MTSEELELLTQAAKASKTKIRLVTEIDTGFFDVHMEKLPQEQWYFVTEGYVRWEPLEDDGDALKLAVDALNWPFMGSAFKDQVSALYAIGKLPEDPYEATRLAITMAAAEVGKTIK